MKVKLPCGKTTLIDPGENWIRFVFPHWRIAGCYVRISRYIETKYGIAKEEYYLHTFIIKNVLKIKAVKGFEIDHVNRNKLDNRRKNLRLASRGENAHNKAKAKGCTSKYRGVRYRKNNLKNPWMAYVNKNGKQYCIGHFKTQIDAARAYNEKCKKIYGEFAFQNSLPGVRKVSCRQVPHKEQRGRGNLG